MGRRVEHSARRAQRGEGLGDRGLGAVQTRRRRRLAPWGSAPAASAWSSRSGRGSRAQRRGRGRARRRRQQPARARRRRRAGVSGPPPGPARRPQHAGQRLGERRALTGSSASMRQQLVDQRPGTRTRSAKPPGSSAEARKVAGRASRARGGTRRHSPHGAWWWITTRSPTRDAAHARARRPRPRRRARARGPRGACARPGARGRRSRRRRRPRTRADDLARAGTGSGRSSITTSRGVRERATFTRRALRVSSAASAASSTARDAALGNERGDQRRGVTSKAGLRTARAGQRPARRRAAHLVGVALLDLDVRRRSACAGRPSTPAPATTKGCRPRARRARARRCRPCWRRRRWRRRGRRRRSRRRPRRGAIRPGGGAVDEQRVRRARPRQLPDGQPGALQQRPGLAREHLHRRPRRAARASTASAVPPARRGQRAGVAVRQQPPARRRAASAPARRDRRAGGVLLGVRSPRPRRAAPARRSGPAASAAARTRSTAQARLTAVGRAVAARVAAALERAAVGRRRPRSPARRPRRSRSAARRARASRADRVGRLRRAGSSVDPALLAGSRRLVEEPHARPSQRSGGGDRRSGASGHLAATHAPPHLRAARIACAARSRGDPRRGGAGRARLRTPPASRRCRSATCGRGCVHVHSVVQGTDVASFDARGRRRRSSDARDVRRARHPDHASPARPSTRRASAPGSRARR